MHKQCVPGSFSPPMHKAWKRVYLCVFQLFIDATKIHKFLVTQHHLFLERYQSIFMYSTAFFTTRFALFSVIKQKHSFFLTLKSKCLLYIYFPTVISQSWLSLHLLCSSTAHYYPLPLFCRECVLCHTHCHLMLILPPQYPLCHTL